jgi:hypothetical protein
MARAQLIGFGLVIVSMAQDSGNCDHGNYHLFRLKP